MLRTYRICDLTVGFSKYEFNNKLLGGVTFFRVTLGVTHSDTNDIICDMIVFWELNSY